MWQSRLRTTNMLRVIMVEYKDFSLCDRDSENISRSLFCLILRKWEILVYATIHLKTTESCFFHLNIQMT